MIRLTGFFFRRLRVSNFSQHDESCLLCIEKDEDRDKSSQLRLRRLRRTHRILKQVLISMEWAKLQ